MPKRKRKDDFSVLKNKKKGIKRPREAFPLPCEVDTGNVEDTEDMADEGFLAGELKHNFLTKMKIDKLLTVTKKKKDDNKDPVPVSHDACTGDSEPEEEEEGLEEEDDSEREYEKIPRATSWEKKKDEEEKDLHYLLPLKESHGRLVQQQPTVLAKQEANDDCVASEDEQGISEVHSPGVGEEDVSRELTVVERFVQSQELMAEKKEAIEQYVKQLMEDPEGNVGVLKQLRTLCAERRSEIAVEIRKLAMSAFLEVIKDIAPSYHIRELTEAEKAVKVSKDVRKLRHFEQTLVMEYRLYLSLCDETIKASLLKGRADQKKEKKRKRERNKPIYLLDNDEPLPSSDMESLGEVSVECFCELLASLPHFNFANNIIASIVCLMPSKALQGKISKLCCEAIETLFKHDPVGQISYEAVRLISKLVKSKSYMTRPAVKTP